MTTRGCFRECALPGGTVELHIPVRAPAEVGMYKFAARMVHEGVAWFGATAQITGDVVPHGGKSPGKPDVDDDDKQGGSASGCSTTSGAGMVFVLFALLAQRRRNKPNSRVSTLR